MMFFFGGPIFFALPFFFVFMVLRFLMHHDRRFRGTMKPFPSFEDETANPRLSPTIFRLAGKMKGRLTLSDIIIETNLEPQEAEKAIERLVDGVRVRMEVDENGIVFYEFPEIISRIQDH